jgi:hypothetical protein
VGVAIHDVLVDLAVEADRQADVAGIEVVAAVDDQPDAVRRALRPEHLRVDALVVDGVRRSDAIARLRRHPPDVVVLLPRPRSI